VRREDGQQSAHAAPAAGALPYLATAGFASMGSIRAADAMLPALAADFGRVPSDTAAVITAFALAYGLMQLVWGPLGDRVGKLRVIGWAALAATLGSIACALAPTLPLLTAARLLTGACCAAIIPLAIAHVGDTVAYEVRQATLARLATGTLTGLIAGQVLGGLAADTVGWRAAFGALALLFLVAGTAMLRLATRLPRAAAAGAAPGTPAPGGVAALLRGYGAVLATGWARTVIAVAFIEGALLFGPLAFVPTWLHQRTGVTLAGAGGVVAAVGVGGLLYTFTARRWIAALGERGLATGGAGLIAIAFAALVSAVSAGAGRPLEVAACLFVGVGFYMLHNTLQTLATQLAPGARATAIGLFAVALFMGQSAGVEITARLGPSIGFEPVFVGAGLLLALTGAGLGVGIARRRA
jgi:predicted MFS family arabinose efflux permease